MIFVDRRSDGSVCGIIIICGGDGVGVGGVTSIAVVVIIHRCSVLVAVAVVVLANDGRCGGGGGDAARDDRWHIHTDRRCGWYIYRDI